MRDCCIVLGEPVRVTHEAGRGEAVSVRWGREGAWQSTGGGSGGRGLTSSEAPGVSVPPPLHRAAPPWSVRVAAPSCHPLCSLPPSEHAPAALATATPPSLTFPPRPPPPTPTPTCPSRSNTCLLQVADVALPHPPSSAPAAPLPPPTCHHLRSPHHNMHLLLPPNTAAGGGGWQGAVSGDPHLWESRWAPPQGCRAIDT